MTPALVLGFDTSGPACTAALIEGGRVLACRTEEMATGQAERLMPLLAEMLAEAGRGFADLSAIGVGTGPGNFTGVRISVAAARGLALARAIPAVGVSRLEAAAHRLPRPVLAVEPAMRGGVYLQRFGADHDAGPEGIAAEDLDTAAMAAEGIPLTGSAAQVLAQAMAAPAVILPPAMPLAEAIARIAAERLATPQPRPAPIYLRPADAAPSAHAPPPLLDPA